MTSTTATPDAPSVVEREIPTDRVPALVQRIDALNRRAAKVGFPAMVLTTGPEVVRERVLHGETVLLGYTPVRIVGQPLRIAGWSLSCILDHEHKLVLGIPGKECPGSYWKQGVAAWGDCDRCHVQRPRKRTYVLTDAKGKSVQLGRECVKDYLGHPQAEEMVGHAAAIAEVLRDVDADDGEPGEGARVRYRTEDVLAFTFEHLAHHPYRKADSEEGSTATALRMLLRKRRETRDTTKPDAHAVEQAKAAIAWLLAEPSESTYIANLQQIARAGFVDPDGPGFGMWVSLPIAYDRARMRASSGGGHVGAVNERRVFDVVVERVQPYEGDFGTTYTYVFRDPDQNVLVWRASKELAHDGRTARAGDRLALTCTVTDHVTGKNGKETRISRCAPAKPDDAKKTAKRKPKADPLAKQFLRAMKRAKQIYAWEDPRVTEAGEDILWETRLTRDVRRPATITLEEGAAKRAAELTTLLTTQGVGTARVEHIGTTTPDPGDAQWETTPLVLRVSPLRQDNPAPPLAPIQEAMRGARGVYGLRVDDVRHPAGKVLGPSMNIETGERLHGTSVIGVRKNHASIQEALALLSVYFGPWLTLVAIADEEQDLGPGTDAGERLFASPRVVATFPHKGRQGNPAKTLRAVKDTSAIVLAYERAARDPVYGGAPSELLSVTITTAPGTGFAGSGKLAYVRARRRVGAPVFHMDAAGAVHGWGPLAYDLLMERVTEFGAAIAPDPSSVTDAAQQVWARYAERPDVRVLERFDRFPGDGVYQKDPALLPIARKKAGFVEEGFPRAGNPVSPATALAYGYLPRALGEAAPAASKAETLPSGWAGPNRPLSEMVANAFRQAELALGVVTKDAILGCGSFGCVAPTEDGGVLKVTTDWHEVLLFLLVWKHGIPGFARIQRGPVLLPMRDIEGRAAYAYTREDLPKTARDVDDEVGHVLRGFRYSERERLRDVAENITALGRFPAFKDLAAGLRTLVALGYDVQDLRPANLAWRDGQIVARDAMAVARVPLAVRDARAFEALDELLRERAVAERLRNPVTLSPTKEGWPGKSHGVALASLPQDELARGVAHEREHTPNRFLATRIAADHLVEDPAYYTHIEAMEREQNPHGHALLPLAEVERWEPLAASSGVSEVARSARGFLGAYRAAKGRFDKLPAAWRTKREGFLARHLAQAKGEAMFDESGMPTRRHLALIMWAYSPAPARLRAARQDNPRPRAIDVGLTPAELAEIRARVAAGEVTDEDTERLILWAPRARAAAGAIGRPRSDWKDMWRRWVPDTRTDLEARQELLAFLDTYSHDAIAAKAGAKAAAAKAERADRAYETQGVDLEDLWHEGEAAVRRKASGQWVWMYHGTSSTLLPDILAHGLRPGAQRIDAKTPGIFLTTQPGRGAHTGGTAWFYASRAAAHFGGEPVVLRVLVPFDSLEPDPDDEDIQAGRHQYVIDAVAPAWIYEVNGEKTPNATPTRRATPRKPRKKP